jgi:hypothetical protein
MVHQSRGLGEAGNLEVTDPRFKSWMKDVRRMTRKYIGVELEALPDLPYKDGFEAGETPAEFYVGAVLDGAELVGLKTREQTSAAIGKRN